MYFVWHNEILYMVKLVCNRNPKVYTYTTECARLCVIMQCANCSHCLAIHSSDEYINRSRDIPVRVSHQDGDFLICLICLICLQLIWEGYWGCACHDVMHRLSTLPPKCCPSIYTTSWSVVTTSWRAEIDKAGRNWHLTTKPTTTQISGICKYPHIPALRVTCLCCCSLHLCVRPSL